MIQSSIKFTDKLIKEIDETIQEEVAREFDAAMARVTARKNEIVAGVLLRVQHHVSMHRQGEEIVFTVKQDSK